MTEKQTSVYLEDDCRQFLIETRARTGVTQKVSLNSAIRLYALILDEPRLTALVGVEHAHLIRQLILNPTSNEPIPSQFRD